MSCSPSAGIGAQERGLRQLGIPYEVLNTCDLDKDSVLSYAAMRYNLEAETEKFNFPTKEEMIATLQEKNVGLDFKTGKQTINDRTNIDKLKLYYLSDHLSRNLGDISKVDKLPYADLVTYSFPCTDLSVAGKGKGMKNICDKCGYEWHIDFEHPENNDICPSCNSVNTTSTRSGLLGEVQRLLVVAQEKNTLPSILLMENVKNLVGKKFKPQFDSWLQWLDSIGYNSYWKVLNGKHYGIPQNRERVFAISIRKDVDTNGFIFPEAIPLTTRLKDMLEKNVDEKYYLPDDRIDKILNSSFMQEKKRIQTTDVCDTLLARDWKDPKCVPVEDNPEVKQLMNIMPTKTRDNPNQGRVYDINGIAPTLTKMDGGNREPMIIDEIKVIGNYMPSNHDASRVVDIDGIAPTVKENHGTVTAIAEPQVVKVGQVSSEGSQAGMVYAPEGIAPTLCAGCHGYAMGNILEEQEPFIVASRGRNPENPSDRTVGAPTKQRLEPNFSGCTNTLTSVQKDNYVCEPKVAIVEDQFPGSRDARIYPEYSPTLRQNCGGLKVAKGNVEEKIKWRIRKLTPKCCWRLMGFTDKDHDRAAKYTSASARYKQAGNSIITSCLIALMSSMFIEDGHKAEVWTKYLLNYND